MEEQNGSLVLCDPVGQQIKRHVTQTKKVQQWRETKPLNTQESVHHANPDVDDQFQRPRREKRTPSYLSEYVRSAEQGFRNLEEVE